MPVGEPLLSAADKNRHAAVDMIMLYGHAYCSQLGGNPVAGMNIVNSSMRLLKRALDGRLFTDLNACNEYTTGIKAATKIQASTTLFWERRTIWHHMLWQSHCTKHLTCR